MVRVFEGAFRRDGVQLPGGPSPTPTPALSCRMPENISFRRFCSLCSNSGRGSRYYHSSGFGLLGEALLRGSLPFWGKGVLPNQEGGATGMLLDMAEVMDGMLRTRADPEGTLLGMGGWVW